jgi:hypothetical protein
VLEHRHDPVVPMTVNELGQSKPEHSTVGQVDVGENCSFLDAVQVIFGEFVEVHLGRANPLASANRTFGRTVRRRLTLDRR